MPELEIGLVDWGELNLNHESFLMFNIKKKVQAKSYSLNAEY